MRRIYTLPLVVLLTSSSLFLAQQGKAEERRCRGAIGSVTVDNLKVPDGSSCSLNGTRVKGNIVVGSNAKLIAQNIKVNGSIQAENATQVDVTSSSSVGGSIQIKQGQKAKVVETSIAGNLQLESNSGALTAQRNTIGGNLQAFQNTGGILIRRNRIDGNLQCKENNPPPTGGNNTVEGSKEDQCARL